MIDFDSSFFADNPPENNDDFQGDMLYLSPEGYLYMDGTIDYHNIEYQIRNAEGVYVWVNCKGRISLDANGNPEYFAGFVSNLGRRNKIDPITNLFTMFEFLNS